MDWKIYLIRFLGCIFAGWMLGEAIIDYKAGRYRMFGIDLMFFVTLGLPIVLSQILSYLN